MEFVALPGAGKSSVSHKVAGYLSQRGLFVTEPVRALSDRSRWGARLRGYLGKSLHVARELLTHPRCSFRSLRAIRDTEQPTLSVLVGVGVNWLMQCSLLRSRRAIAAIHLFDEGIFQALWSIGLEGRRGAVRYVGSMVGPSFPLPEVVAVIEADLRSVQHRLATRAGGESRADRWSIGDEAVFTHASGIMDEVMEFLVSVSEQQRRPRVIRVANGDGDSLDAAARDLALEIERVVCERRSQGRAQPPP